MKASPNKATPKAMDKRRWRLDGWKLVKELKEKTKLVKELEEKEELKAELKKEKCVLEVTEAKLAVAEAKLKVDELKAKLEMETTEKDYFNRLREYQLLRKLVLKKDAELKKEKCERKEVQKVLEVTEAKLVVTEAKLKLVKELSQAPWRCEGDVIVT